MRTVIAALAAVMIAAPACAQQILGIATNPQGTAAYSTGAAIARVLEDKSPLKARPQPVGGSSTYLPMVNNRDMDFGLANLTEAMWAYSGTGTFEGKPNPNLRLAFVTYGVPSAITVAADSPYKAIADLKGARMPSEFAAQTIFKALQDAMLANGGLSMADMKPFPVRNYTDGLRALQESRVDAAVAGASTAVVTEINSAMSGRGGVRYVPVAMDPDAVKRTRAVMPGFYIQVLQPSPTLAGVKEPMPVMHNSFLLVAGAHVPDETIYVVVKTMHANKDALIDSFTAFRGFDPARMNEAAAVPYHPGAERFYREAGQWPPLSR